MAGFVWKWMNKHWIRALKSNDHVALRRLHAMGFPKLGAKESLSIWLMSLGPTGLKSQKAGETASVLAELGVVSGMSGALIISLLKTETQGALDLVMRFASSDREVINTAWGLPMLYLTRDVPHLEDFLGKLSKSVPMEVLVSLGPDWIDVAGKWLPASRVNEVMPLLSSSTFLGFLQSRWKNGIPKDLLDEVASYGNEEFAALSVCVAKFGLSAQVVEWMGRASERGVPVCRCLLLAELSEIRKFIKEHSEVLNRDCFNLEGFDPSKPKKECDDLVPPIVFSYAWQSSSMQKEQFMSGIPEKVELIRSSLASLRLKSKHEMSRPLTRSL